MPPSRRTLKCPVRQFQEQVQEEQEDEGEGQLEQRSQKRKEDRGEELLDLIRGGYQIAEGNGGKKSRGSKRENGQVFISAIFLDTKSLMQMIPEMRSVKDLNQENSIG